MTSAGLPSIEISQGSFGQLADGSDVMLYTLQSAAVKLQLISYGARVVSLETADREGRRGDIALGYGSLEPYVSKKNAYFGTIVGRYANRIAKGEFTLDGKPYQIPVNNPPNALHSGFDGYDARNWTSSATENGVEFTLRSSDGDQGFPGALRVRVRYTLEDNRVRIEYEAQTDQTTVVNLTNHTYFNLLGDGKPSVLDEVLRLDADLYTPVDAMMIPTGEIAAVAGTPFDFTQPAEIGKRIGRDNEQLKRARGYDHNFVVRGQTGQLRSAAEVYDPASGRVLKLQTTEPGVQFYSGNFLDGTLQGKTGAMYVQRSGFCLETQHYPDSPNQPGFPSTQLKAGETFRSETTWTFETRA